MILIGGLNHKNKLRDKVQFTNKAKSKMNKLISLFNVIVSPPKILIP